MIRSFIGLPLPEHAVRGLQSLQTGLPIARAVEPENLHLTLAFLDNQPEAMLRSLAEDLGEIRFDPFEIRLSGISLLGGKQPGAIAVNADGGDTLVALQARIAHTVRMVGIELERRRFRPHVTIFRLHKHLDQRGHEKIQGWIDRFARFEAIPYSVDRFALFESRLSKNGASHFVLAEYFQEG
ncbi:RNA 2',3'-cyclic phosphodiesterase [Silicimonas sp. MF1-12-2]|uniref:RNA 2',3'-cyclic phosphodiesterase n=1 Tax=Silicimonas sp. MF1-12-2 TaxID=3384793 RepID=UPI0039B6C6CD